jgi:hypothetical protein
MGMCVTNSPTVEALLMHSLRVGRFVTCEIAVSDLLLQ